MKRRIILIVAILALSLIILPACRINTESSVKTLSMPFIAQYECTEARFGEDNLLENFEYIKIILKNKEELEVVYKPKGGEKKISTGLYKLNTETMELEGEIGILGYRYKEKVKLERGGFIISKILMKRELYMKFEIK